MSSSASSPAGVVSDVNASVVSASPSGTVGGSTASSPATAKPSPRVLHLDTARLVSTPRPRPAPLPITRLAAGPEQLLALTPLMTADAFSMRGAKYAKEAPRPSDPATRHMLNASFVAPGRGGAPRFWMGPFELAFPATPFSGNKPYEATTAVLSLSPVASHDAAARVTAATITALRALEEWVIASLYKCITSATDPDIVSKTKSLGRILKNYIENGVPLPPKTFAGLVLNGSNEDASAAAATSTSSAADVGKVYPPTVTLSLMGHAAVPDGAGGNLFLYDALTKTWARRAAPVNAEAGHAVISRATNKMDYAVEGAAPGPSGSILMGDAPGHPGFAQWRKLVVNDHTYVDEAEEAAAAAAERGDDPDAAAAAVRPGNKTKYYFTPGDMVPGDRILPSEIDLAKVWVNTKEDRFGLTLRARKVAVLPNCAFVNELLDLPYLWDNTLALADRSLTPPAIKDDAAAAAARKRKASAEPIVEEPETEGE